jgi:hypothetical protein
LQVAQAIHGTGIESRQPWFPVDFRHLGQTAILPPRPPPAN